MANTITKSHYKSSMKRNKLVFDIVVYTILGLGTFIMLYPLWWMIVASFNTKATVYSVSFWPVTFAGLANYKEVFTNLSTPTYFRALLNTMLFSVLPVAFGTIVSCLAAYAFAKIPFRGRNTLFLVLLTALMIPFPAIMVTQFTVFKTLGWLNTPLTQIIPKMFGGIICIFFIRQYLYGLPNSIIESARIDGAGYLTIFIRMIMPLAMPAMVAQFLLGFMGSWNDYLGPYLFVSNEQWWPITVALANFNSGNELQIGIPTIMAGSVLAVVPVLVLFGLFQKTIIESVMLTGSKE